MISNKDIREVNILQVIFTLKYPSRVKITRENLLSALKKGMQAEYNDPSIGVTLND